MFPLLREGQSRYCVPVNHSMSQISDCSLYSLMSTYLGHKKHGGCRLSILLFTFRNLLVTILSCKYVNNASKCGCGRREVVVSENSSKLT